jgi:exodeoxyribonuclease VII small subunit
VAKKRDLSFAEARARLDEILSEVESDSGDVDQLAAKVREAAELIRFCRDRLAAARHEVTQVVADLAALEQSVAATDVRGDADDSGDADDADEGTGDDEDDAGEERGARPPTGRLPF